MTASTPATWAPCRTCGAATPYAPNCLSCSLEAGLGEPGPEPEPLNQPQTRRVKARRLRKPDTETAMSMPDASATVLTEEEFANLKAACDAPPRMTPYLEDVIRRSRETFEDDPRAASDDTDTSTPD